LAAGQRLTEMLKQGQYVPQRVGYQVVQVFAGTQNMPNERKTWVRDIPVVDIPRYCTELGEFIGAKHPKLLDLIEEKLELSDEVRSAIEKCLKDFADAFTPTEED